MQHLDEGTIHAWLDGALSADEAERVERHANECASCAALVAEARGLVAGASRILSALDDVPAVVPEGGGWRVEGGEGRGRAPTPRHWWSRPTALAAAASIILMAGSLVVLGRTGGRESLVGPFADSAENVPVPTTEAAAPMTGSDASAAVGPAAPPAQGLSRDGRGTAAAAPRATPAPTPPRQSVAAARKAEGTGRPTETKAVASPTDRAANVQRRESPLQLQDVVVTAAPAAGGAAAQRAAVANEKAALAPPPAAAAAPEQRGGRVDTVYLKPRIDTVIVDPPENPRFRPPGGVVGRTRIVPVTGCYQVVQGPLPKTITLTTEAVWSGAAERGFVATAPGATGYWSQPRSGDVHLVIDRWVVTARIDATTGELRGTAQRGRTREAFRAKRGC